MARTCREARDKPGRPLREILLLDHHVSGHKRLILVPIALLASLVAASLYASDFERAEALFKKGELAQAEALYSGIAPTDPNYPQALLRLGKILYVTERPALAEQKFLAYLKFHQSAEAYCLLAGTQFNQKKFTEAYDSAQRSLQLDPAYAKAYTALGMIDTAVGNRPDAKSAYQQALKLNPRDADTWYMLGRSYFLWDEFGEAKEAFQASLRLDPGQVRAYENLSWTLDLLNEPDEAEKNYRQGIRASERRKSADPHIYIAFGKFLSKRGRAAEGVAELRAAVQVAPRDSEAHYELATQLFNAKDLSEARKEGETALLLGSGDYRVAYLLARICTALGDSPAASKYAQVAASLAQNNPAGEASRDSASSFTRQ